MPATATPTPPASASTTPRPAPSSGSRSAASTSSSPRSASASRSRGCCSAAPSATRDDALDGEAADRLAPWRGALHRREHGIAEMCAKEGIRLDAGALVYLSHWLTPLGRAKRYDTRFFIAAAPASQVALFDGTEMVEQLWIAPAEALARSKTLKLLTPTQKTLELVSRFADVAALMAWAREPRRVPLTMPHVAIGSQGPRPVMPDEPAYAELGRIDPAGHGHGCYDIVPDRPVRLSERVIRVTAGNGSVMTGPGTNTYLVGGGPNNEWAAIDPGPGARRACRGDRRGRTRDHHPHLRDPYPHRPFAGDRGAEGPHRRHRPRPGGAPSRMAGRQLRPGRDPARRRADRAGAGDDAGGDPHARPCLEPSLLPARGREDALHRRPRDADVDGGHQSARRRHARLRRIAALAARRSISTGWRPVTASSWPSRARRWRR